ncbi:MAG: IS66 family transposase [Burkholderiaceae bacterium]|nr:IS66 family transposase [Burkholderiaceae bacterium]
MDTSLLATETIFNTDEPVAQPTPFDLETVTLTRREHVELKTAAAHYKRLHGDATKRIEHLRTYHQMQINVWQEKCKALQANLDHAQAQLRGLRQQTFGKRAERADSLKPRHQGLPPECRTKTKRPRGQQHGWQGHGRTRVMELPVREEVLAVDPCCCPKCGLGFVEMAGTQDAEVLEIEVKPYRRQIRRQRLRATCQCRALPGIVTAPAPPQLIPRGKLGVSLLTEALLSKYRHGVPIYRLLQQWRDLGLPVAQGTLTGNLQQLLPLFAPLTQAGLKHLRASNAWHADETRWEVFDPDREALRTRHYLWVFRCAEVIHFEIDPSRSASVPASVLEGVQCGVLSVDRYAAYGKYARQTPGIQLAYCWAHQRRDFLSAASQFPSLWPWALEWIERIGQLYALHDKRHLLSSTPDSDAFGVIDQLLRQQVQAIHGQCQAELSQEDLHAKAHAVLRSMTRHWSGLVTFVDYPKLDLDNNKSERSLRPAVVGRKNYYGSGSQTSAQLAATMMSLFATLDAWRINPRRWLTEYLQACAVAGGQPPDDCGDFIPWQMDETRLATLREGYQPRAS